MLLGAHIIMAISSMALMLAALAGRLRRPDRNYHRLAQGSATTFAGLVATGTALVIQNNSPILGACMGGLAYFGCLSVVYLLYRKLALES